MLQYTPTQPEVSDVITGPAQIETLDAEFTTSQKGNPMVKLKCKAKSGTTVNTFFHYLVKMPENDDEFRNLKDFCYKFGIGDYYQNQQVTETVMKGLNGYAEMKVEEYNGEPQNKAHYFITKSEYERKLKGPQPPAYTPKSTTATKTNDIIDDDVPF